VKSTFDLVCLFGYSPFFVELSRFCAEGNVRCALVFGSRQQDSIETLCVPDGTLKIKTDSLACQKYQQLEISNKNCLGISFGAPFIFTQSEIDEFKGNLINSHGAPLPDFKGGGGFSWRILQRDKRGASLMHFVSPQIDEGDCVFRHDFQFSESERLPIDYESRQAQEDKNNLMPWLQAVIKKELILKSMGESRHAIDAGTYFPRLYTDIHGFMDWSMPIHELESFMLAFSRPYSGASTFFKGERLRLFDCRIHDLCDMHQFTWGLIIAFNHGQMLVAVNGGVIKIGIEDVCFDREVKRIAQGDRLITPANYIRRAISSRAYFKPDGVLIKDFDVRHPSFDSKQ